MEEKGHEMSKHNMLVESHFYSIIISIIGAYIFIERFYGMDEANVLLGGFSIAVMIWVLVEWVRRFIVSIRNTQNR
jgi:hypothetical protein